MRYEIAVINYPLMDPNIPRSEYTRRFDFDYRSKDQWDVPVYIHVPFCDSICNFCVYHRQVPDKQRTILQRFTEALVKEIKMYAETAYIKSLNIGAIFIGGGTPTCLSTQQLQEIVTCCKEYLPLKEGVEISVECNIVNADEEKIAMLSETGVTRVSTGVQTFNPQLRADLNLPLPTDRVFQWIDMVQSYGFHDTSIDLLFGSPGQTVDHWLEDLNTAVSLSLEHLSIYSMIVLAYTKLYKQIKNQQLPQTPDEDVLKQMFIEADRVLKSHGYYMQTVQEYCRSDRAVDFWELTYDGYGDNLSLGPFSFGYLNGVTYQNEPNIKKYMELIDDDLFPFQMISRKITFEQLMERAMIFSFRRSLVDKSVFFDQFGKTVAEQFSSILEPLMEKNLVLETEDQFKLTEEGCFYQGDISAQFMESTFAGMTRNKKRISISRHIVPEAV